MGYAELLNAIKDPQYERHAELTEWICVDFDPDAVDHEWLTAASPPSPEKGRQPREPAFRSGELTTILYCAPAPSHRQGPHALT